MEKETMVKLMAGQEVSEQELKSKWELLKEPMTYKWRVQSSGEYYTTLVAYIDARDVEDKLDNIISPENWKNTYGMVGSQMLSGIGIYDPDKKEWIFKYDGGTESNIEKAKGLLSDSFKRAAVKWGIGRFLYSKKVYKLASMDTGKKDRNNKPVYAPKHNEVEHGPENNVPYGLLYKGKINNVNDYIWQFLKPYMENKNKQ